MLKTAGINHIALVCRDMRETADFYTRVLGMPLVKTVELPGGGQHWRINISIDRGILDAIDAAATSRKLTRSAFLTEAARNEIEGRH